MEYYYYHDEEPDWNGSFEDSNCHFCLQSYNYCECGNCMNCSTIIDLRSEVCSGCNAIIKRETENEEKQFKFIFKRISIDYFKSLINETNINKTNKNGNNLLDLIVKYIPNAEYEKSIFLIESGININDKNDCFEYFARRNSVETCRLIMDKTSQKFEIKNYSKEIIELILSH